MKKIPLLKPEDVEARVQKIGSSENGPYAMLLLYKSARTDMRVLDDVFGPMNWKRSHQDINGSLFCTISVWDEEKKEWISKQDVGTPSNRDSKKGEASDSFKRAGFCWGIGRELYDAPTIFVNLNPNELNGRNLRPGVEFKVSAFDYNEGKHEFNRLTLVDKGGNVRYSLPNSVNAYQNQRTANTPLKSDFSQGSNDELAIEVADKLYREKIDPNQFAKNFYKTDFNSLTDEQLSYIKGRFEKAVTAYRNRKGFA